MCDAWKNSFEAFYADMGPCPNHEYWGLDRINNDGNYEPRNCRWTTPMVQSNNRRKKVRRVWFNIGMNVEVRTYLQKLATQNGEKVHELIERICISHLEKMAAEKKVRK